MRLIIGISGGHHESSAVFFDADSRSISDKLTGDPINPHNQPWNELVTRLHRLLSQIANLLSRKPSSLRDLTGAIVLALPGAGTQRDWDKGVELLRDVGMRDQPRHTVADDTWAGLFAETLSTKGICAFAGTGASVYIGLADFIPEKNYKIDGWGPIIGDYGSAFQLVVDFFRRIGRCHDKNPDKSIALFEEMRASANAIPELKQVQGWFDEQVLSNILEWRIRFALLAKPITQAADRETAPNSLAIELVTSCASQMADSILIAVRRFGNALDELPIVFQGGLFKYSECYRKGVLMALPESLRSRCRLARLDPCFGSLFMACQKQDPALVSVAHEAALRKFGR